ncbi:MULTISPECIES: hypothetical protein [Nostocales]|uniref:Uncharacterized protein n=3 Tax=Nostocales TaxID=1161 RepID=A0A0C1NGD5_9CYAN|nr:hypothetical protein [Tolypothrix bouteillei]KAF3884173.1 hypothetical protein DA73_0400000660 [Tolypothrix bouteillei VB521301]
MNKYIQIQLKLNTFNFLKLSLIALAVLFSFGTYTRANAESESGVEVISIPPQEAYYTEEKIEDSSSGDRSKVENKNTSDNNNFYVPDNVEDSQNVNIANSSVPRILPIPADS